VLKNKRILILTSVVMIMFLFFSNFFIINANATTSNNSVNYTIKKGDTFYLLSLRFNSSINDISSTNPGIYPQNLIIGSKIKQPIGSGITIHHVKEGDTLWKIAKKYNSTINTIAVKNYIVDPNLIYKSDILAIPQEKHDNKIVKELSQISGSWKSTNANEYHGTQLVITPTGNNTFLIKIYAFNKNVFGSVHEGGMSGKGQVNNNKIEFIIDENLKGEISLQSGKLFINFIGETRYGYGGARVFFETEFIRGSLGF